RNTDYCCQEDGMIGLGPGARSYTQALHYSTEYAVGQGGVRRIIEEFNGRAAGRHAVADYGVRLNGAEQQLRYVIKSLLGAEGVSRDGYKRRFGSEFSRDLPQLGELDELGLAIEQHGALRLTEEGMAWTDTIGPWLYSKAVAGRM